MEWVIASDAEAAISVAKLIRAGQIPRTLHSEIEAKAEMASRGFMMARYRLYRCTHRLNGTWLIEGLEVPLLPGSTGLDDNALAAG